LSTPSLKAFHILPLRLPICLFPCLIALTGCGAAYDQHALTPAAGIAIGGNVHGGNQPVSNAKIYLYAAGANGYGTASRSMLNGPGYVVSESDGTFSITGDYACQADDQVYLVARGGNPGLVTNTDNQKLTLMTALGPCASLNAGQSFTINEVTTVATAYALNGFMSGIEALSSSGTPLAKQGVANAFANVNNLVDVTSGLALSTFAGVPNSVPQAEINTLANIVAACVNSDGAGMGCSGLAAAVGIDGVDTATALLHIASHPASNANAIYALSAANPPFQPSLATAPNDFSVAIRYSIQNSQARGVAIDGFGNAWFAGGDSDTVSELTPNGHPAAPRPSGFSGGSLALVTSVALDDSNNAWFSNYGNQVMAANVTKLNNAGRVLSPSNGFTGGGIFWTQSIAIDPMGNAWVGDGYGVSKFDTTGAPLSPAGGFGYGVIYGPAIDYAGNFWAATGSGVIKLDNSGNILSGSNGFAPFTPDGTYVVAIDRASNAWVAGLNSLGQMDPGGNQLQQTSGGGLGIPVGMAIDGAGSVFVASGSYTHAFSDSANLAVFDRGGNPLSGPKGLLSTSLTAPSGVAIDGSGNVWVSDQLSGTVVFIGLAKPTITPLATAIKLKKLASAP
jgi:hypothetical protein